MTVYTESIVTRTMVTAAPGDSVRAVAVVFSPHGISALPVCDKDAR